MSKPLGFENFCKHYEYNIEDKKSKELYEKYCSQLEFFSVETEKKNSENWGGKRANSGRKAKYESTKTLRVPTQYIDVIKSLIAHLDETDGVDFNYKSAESDSVFLRSRKDKKQKIKFTTIPIER